MFPLLPFPEPSEIILFTLVIGRMAGLFTAIPLFGGKGVPSRVKVAIIFTMALVFFPVVRSYLPAIPTDVLSLGLLVGREVLVGLSMGLLSQVVFSAVEGEQNGPIAFCSPMLEFLPGASRLAHIGSVGADSQV